MKLVSKLEARLWKLESSQQMKQMENFEHPAFGGTIELRYELRQRQTKEFIRINPEGFQLTI